MRVVNKPPIIYKPCYVVCHAFQSEGLTYENVFRIVIMGFMDKYDFDIGSVKRSCTHFVEPNGKIYPFDTWNLFTSPASTRLIYHFSEKYLSANFSINKAVINLF